MLALPNSFWHVVGLVAAGVALRQTVSQPSDAQVVQRLVCWLTAPAIVFCALSGPGFHVACAGLAAMAAVLHALVSGSLGWLLFRKRFRPKERALLRSAVLGGDVSTVALAWCASVWGIAGAEMAAVFLVTNAVTQHLAAYLISGSGSAGRPQNFKHADGGTYSGEWAGLSKHGLGVYTYPNGAKYEGDWQQNLKHGWGVYHYPDGGKFEGSFVDGQRSGLGVRSWPAGNAKAAFFHKGAFQRHADLGEAASTLAACAETAAAARSVELGSATLRKAVQSPRLVAVLAAAGAAAAVRAVPALPAEQLSAAAGVLASLHIPLSLMALGVRLERVEVPKRHAFAVRTVLAIRLLSGLVVALLALTFSPPRLPHGMRAAAMAVCLLAPIGPELQEYAERHRLPRELAASLSRSSLWASAAVCSVVAAAAWLSDLVPAFATAGVVGVSSGAVVNACLALFAWVCIAAATVPRLAAGGDQRTLVKMTYAGASDNAAPVPGETRSAQDAGSPDLAPEGSPRGATDTSVDAPPPSAGSGAGEQRRGEGSAGALASSSAPCQRWATYRAALGPGRHLRARAGGRARAGLCLAAGSYAASSWEPARACEQRQAVEGCATRLLRQHARQAIRVPMPPSCRTPKLLVL